MAKIPRPKTLRNFLWFLVTQIGKNKSKVSSQRMMDLRETHKQDYNRRATVYNLAMVLGNLSRELAILV